MNAVMTTRECHNFNNNTDDDNDEDGDDEDEEEDEDEEKNKDEETMSNNFNDINNQLVSIDVNPLIVNGSNTWLPAYGFQMQHHQSFKNFQPISYADLHLNESNKEELSFKYLETILEETSDDLQSDSDHSDGNRSYWLGSDSEAGSVIHIRKHSAKEFNGNESAVSKKRRRRNVETNEYFTSIVLDNPWISSPRSSSRSSSSSQSSSLAQFETLERTCATISPLSGYSYDSLEYSNYSNCYFENTSPDSLEDSESQIYTRPKSSNPEFENLEFYTKIRPYKSFESLDTCHLNEFSNEKSVKKNFHNEVYDNEDYYNKNHLTSEDCDNNLIQNSLDWKKTIDLREIGLETDRETVLLDLTRSQRNSSLDLQYSKLNIDNIISKKTTTLGITSGEEEERRRGWSNLMSSGFNFRLTNKSHSVPSLPSDLDVLSTYFTNNLYNNEVYKTSKNLFNTTSSNYIDYPTKVASVPVDLDYFGINSSSTSSSVKELVECNVDSMNFHEMADELNDMAYYQMNSSSSSIKKKFNEQEDNNYSGSGSDNNDDGKEKIQTDVHSLVLTSITNADQQDIVAAAGSNSLQDGEEEEEEVKDEKVNKIKSTVKTQDRGFDVVFMENNIDAVVDEAIRQLKNQVEEAVNYTIEQTTSSSSSSVNPSSYSKQRPRKVKNNASYELAQQWEIDDKSCHYYSLLSDNDKDLYENTKKRVLNNPSYELAQQSDYIKALQLTSKPFKRMDACDELHETTNEGKYYENKADKLFNSNIITAPSSSTVENYYETSDNKKTNDDNLFTQIKKNSVPFSIYGEINSNPGIEDEVDFSCLEIKQIGDELVEKLSESVCLMNKKEDDEEDDIEIEKNDDEDAGSENKLMIDLNDEKVDLDNDEREKRVDKIDEKLLNNISIIDSLMVKEGIEDGGRVEELLTSTTMLVNVIENEEVGRNRQHTDRNTTSSPTSMLNNSTYNYTETVGNLVDGRVNDDENLLIHEKLAQIEHLINNPNHFKYQSVNSDSNCTNNTKMLLTTANKHSNNDNLVSGNERCNANDDEIKKKSGLGGFFQKFSKLRFSGRSKHRSTDVKKYQKNLHDNKNENKLIPTATGKCQPDYVIIPLHPPPEDDVKNQPANDNHYDENVNDEDVNQQEDNTFNNLSTDFDDDDDENSSYLSENRSWLAVCNSKPPLPPLHQQNIRACAPSPRMMTMSEGVGLRRRAITDLGNPAAIGMAKARAMHQQQHQYYYNQSAGGDQDRPAGLLETDLDAEIGLIDRNSIGGVNRNRNRAGGREGVSVVGGANTSDCGGGSDTSPSIDKKTRSLLNLNHQHHRDNILLRIPVSTSPSSSSTSPSSRPVNSISVQQDHPVGSIIQRPHKSMEFLLDKENLHFIQAPENELQKMGVASERVPSEHELRVQRSLQRLNVPDWYKNSPAARDGFRLKRHSDASQHSGWRSLGSKTTSLSSLSSSSNLRQPNSGLLSSPTPPPVFSRWSTSLLNSAGSSPANSIPVNTYTYRQPYLGWRSQERLTNPRTPAERLAQGILPQLEAKKQQEQQQQKCNQQLDVRNSIKEVTSAIVHYVQSGQETSIKSEPGRLSPRFNDNDYEIRSQGGVSPKGEGVKLCWMESSFVGTRPVDSPETPMSLTTDTECGCNATGSKTCNCNESSTTGLHLDLAPSDVSGCPSPSSISHHQQLTQNCHRGSTRPNENQKKYQMGRSILRNKPSPGSTTLEDVLDSLLGLPSISSRTSSPGQDHQESGVVGGDVGGMSNNPMLKKRRKSEGSDVVIPLGHLSRTRRVSFDNSMGMDKLVIRCRNNKCSNSTSLADAKRIYKSCHNCSCLYCSRECRRAHWQRHRRTCLHSRIGTLCRQILSTAKDDIITLRYLSNLAKSGYAAHGRGAVKCLFSSPEVADKFLINKQINIGGPIYVRSSDLLLSEMGTELYTEVMKLCKSYNPDTRLVLYVAVCVVSEVPTTDSGVVRWERQLISRCGKIKLDSKHHKQEKVKIKIESTNRKKNIDDDDNDIINADILVLKCSSQFNCQDDFNPSKKLRDIIFKNIQKQLKLRGVSLRRHFPQVYNKLCSYVDGNVNKFAPVTIYPRDEASGKSFMCIIMLSSEPDKLQLLPIDSSKVKTVDISIEDEETN